jgi:hypothetical protein
MSRVSEIWTARRRAEGWTAGERAPFSTGFSDGDPFVSPDGRKLFFVSMRPVRGPRKDFDLYVTERGEQGWGPARNLGADGHSADDEFYPSVAADGDALLRQREVRHLAHLSRPGRRGRELRGGRGTAGTGHVPEI